MNAFDGQGDFGNLSSFGFIVVYILVSIAAPFYLLKMGKLRAIDILYSVLAVGFMLLPAIGTIGIPGSDIFPMPSNNLLVWIFLGYMFVGLCWLFIQRFLSPHSCILLNIRLMRFTSNLETLKTFPNLDWYKV